MKLGFLVNIMMLFPRPTTFNLRAKQEQATEESISENVFKYIPYIL